jgi:hypothetical protein
MIRITGRSGERADDLDRAFDERDRREAAAKARTEACDHYPIRHLGRIICRECRAVWHLGLKGAVWMPPEVGHGSHE